MLSSVILVSIMLHFGVLSGADEILSAARARQIARANCQGLVAEALLPAESLLRLLDSEEGRRAARDAAIHLLFTNGTQPQVLGTKSLPLPTEQQTKYALTICGNPWLDWLPWILCRVQSPPPRPGFEDDDTRIEMQNGGPLCRPQINS